jgi:hypothetical protein
MSINTPNFSQSIALWGAADIKRQDVYFQPALTWMPNATRGVALLFLENFSDSGDINRQDFRELNRGLVRWAWAAAGKSRGDAVTAEDLEDLFEAFGTTPLNYANLSDFLARHFSFVVQESSEEMQATVFPMFPGLELKLGNGTAKAFSPADRMLDAQDISDLRAHFAQMEVQFEAGAKPNTIGASSVAEFLFVGYARLLIRSGLQAGLDHLDGGSSPDMEALLAALPNSEYGNIAQIASRFLLHGFNLPEDTFGTNDPAADEGLYVSTNQQFNFFDSLEGNAYQIALRMGSVVESHIVFPDLDADGRGQLQYSIPDSEDLAEPKTQLLGLARSLNQLNAGDLSELHSAAPKPIPYYREELLHFALRNRVDWEQEGSASDYLLPLPTTLRDHLKQRSPNPVVDLIVWEDSQPENAIDIPNAEFAWATRVNLTLNRIPDLESGGELPGVYQLAGSSEEEKDLLGEVLKFLEETSETNPVELDLLYITDGGSSQPKVKRIPGILSEVRLIKANLSNSDSSSPATSFSRTADAEKGFLGLVWEGLTVNAGGFYFDLPDPDGNTDELLFKGTDSTTLQLLIQFTNTADPIRDFNNFAVFTDEIDVERDLILARSEESVPVLAVPPGYIGFQIDDRAEAPVDLDYPNGTLIQGSNLLQSPESSANVLGNYSTGDVAHMIRYSKDRDWLFCMINGGMGWLKIVQEDGNGNDVNVIAAPGDLNEGPAELNSLYQMLGFQVAGHTQFMESNPGLPLGPTVLPDADGNDTDTWLYERLVPVFSLVSNPPPAGNSSLPLANRNPYLGIGPATGPNASELKLETWWQDVYGNQLLVRKATSLFPVRYTDPLLGINQWPSVAENYSFAKDENDVPRLNLAFTFDTSPYELEVHSSAQDPAQSRENRVKSDLATVEKVYYQLVQEDLSFEVTTSIDPDWRFTNVNKASIVEFVGGMYQFLNGILLGSPVSSPNPYAESIDVSALSIQASFIFEVGVRMEMQRDIDLVLEDLKSGGSIKEANSNVFEAPAILSPKFESLQLQTESGKSLAQLASAFSTATNDSVNAADLIRANSAIANLMVAGQLLAPKDLVVNFGLMDLRQEDWEAYARLEPAALAVSDGETFDELVLRFEADLEEKLGKTLNFGLNDLAAVLANESSLLVPGKMLDLGGLSRRPFASDFQASFPGLLLAVSEDRSNGAPAASSRQPLFAVRLGTDGISYDIQEQRPIYFAVPPLSNSLVTGEVPLDNYAAWKGSIDDSVDLSTLVYAPEAEPKQFEDIDLNVLARNFLVEVERFLEPASLVPANRLVKGESDRVLQQKALLADAISKQVQPVLSKDIGAANTAAELEAEAAIRRELLADLVNGYDIETIVQFGVDVNIGSSLEGKIAFEEGKAPRVRGKAKVLGIKVGEDPDNQVAISPSNLDYSLSTGKIALADVDATSSFTYLFDTKTPEVFANIELDLEFIPTEIEYDIETLPGMGNYEASNWLNFVLPDDLRQTMGASPVPIPLRNYPTPPSLIFQRAEADPSSLTELTDVRQWKYSIVYEHPDVSQDSIDCILQLNVLDTANLPTESGSIVQPSGLFRSLVNFGQIYPVLQADLNLLREQGLTDDSGKTKAAKLAAIAFASLVETVTTDWTNWATGVNIYAPAEGDLHFEIGEESLAAEDERQGQVRILKTVPSKIGGPAILPFLELPGFNVLGEPVHDQNSITYTFKRDPEDLTFFGDSSIPDRRFMLENLDVVEHQNAWASVWLSRNKQLIQDTDGPLNTNPAFVFQTPAVRFNTMVTPFITNDEPWNIATLGSQDGSPQSRTMLGHLSQMIGTLFPNFDGAKYEVRLSCRYAFALAGGKGLNEDLVTTLPILMGLRIKPDALAGSYAADLEAEIKLWLSTNQPSLEDASLRFSVDVFSKLDEDSNSSLPMLRITSLKLDLGDVSDV